MNDLTATKAAAEIKIVSVDGSRYTIRTQPHVIVSGRGVTEMDANTYSVTERALDRLQVTHTWTTAF